MLEPGRIVAVGGAGVDVEEGSDWFDASPVVADAALVGGATGFLGECLRGRCCGAEFACRECASVLGALGTGFGCEGTVEAVAIGG